MSKNKIGKFSDPGILVKPGDLLVHKEDKVYRLIVSTGRYHIDFEGEYEQEIQTYSFGHPLARETEKTKWFGRSSPAIYNVVHPDDK